MARRPAPLSARRVESLRKPGMTADGAGLYFRVTPTGGRSWIFRYMLDGKRHDLGLGSYATVTLADARERALSARRQLVDKIDPIAEKARAALERKKRVATVMTFAQCAEAYVAAHRASWRNPRETAQWSASLRDYIHPVLGELPVEAVDVALVMKILDPLWSTKNETGTRVRSRIEVVLDWAAARGYRQADNPARWRGHLENLLPKPSRVQRVVHHAALPYERVPDVIAQLRLLDGIGARALEFLILTAGRLGEVIGARWSEINLGNRVWILPGERMKSGREHRVPLSNGAAAIIEKMQAIRLDDSLFPSTKPGAKISYLPLSLALKKACPEKVTMHGFRSSFREWCAEQTAFPAEVAELALAHQVGTKVEQAYMRSDLFQKRRQLAEAWARYCDTPVASDPVVVPLHAVVATE
jgi:integrase